MLTRILRQAGGPEDAREVEEPAARETILYRRCRRQSTSSLFSAFSSLLPLVLPLTPLWLAQRPAPDTKLVSESTCCDRSDQSIRERDKKENNFQFVCVPLIFLMFFFLSFLSSCYYFLLFTSSPPSLRRGPERAGHPRVQRRQRHAPGFHAPRGSSRGGTGSDRPAHFPQRDRSLPPQRSPALGLAFGVDGLRERAAVPSGGADGRGLCHRGVEEEPQRELFLSVFVFAVVTVIASCSIPRGAAPTPLEFFDGGGEQA